MDFQQQSAGDDSDGSRRKRRAIAQGQRACNPCRMRKVRCSYQLPCETCVARQLPQLCVYDAPMKRVSLASSTTANVAQIPSPSTSSVAFSMFSPALSASRLATPAPATAPWSPSQSDWDRLLTKIDSLEQTLQEVQQELTVQRISSSKRAGDGNSPSFDETASENAVAAVAASSATTDLPRDDGGVHSVHPVTGEHVFLGANSVPAMAMALSQQPANDSAMVRDLLDRTVLPIFTLENESATYPFVDLWGLPHASPVRIEKLCVMLPSDSECLQCVRQYRDTAHVLYPGVVNIQQFEAEVTRFLITRTSHATDPNKPPLTAQDVYGKSVHWLGLLFACLASGYQSSTQSRRERQLTSQVYGASPDATRWDKLPNAAPLRC